MKSLASVFALVLCCSMLACGGSSSTSFNCLVAASGSSDQACLAYSGLASSDSVNAGETACTNNGGSIVASCPSASLTGCCTNTSSSYTEAACYYGGSATDYQTACLQANGTWSTSLP